MRIIAGKAGSINLKSIKNSNTRPTLDRVKEAMFSMLNPYLKEAKVLDLFAGFGGLGLEAISRGAVEAVLVERSRKNIKVIKENVSKCNFEKKAKVIREDVFDFLNSNNEQFDIIIMDPPYKKEFGEKLLKIISENKILKKTGIIVIEHSKKEKIENQNIYLKIKDKKYGDTKLTFFEYREEI